jgi:hypothetical protein
VDTVSQFAAFVGHSRQAVSKAAKEGRLVRSVTRDERGRVVGIDRTIGLQEWNNANLPQAFGPREARLRVDRLAAVLAAPASGSTAGAPSLTIEGLDQVDQPGRTSVVVRFPLASFLAGATAAFREAGQEPTADALRDVVRSMSDGGWWLAMVAALNAAVDEQVPVESLPEMWVEEGRAAVAAWGSR